MGKLGAIISAVWISYTNTTSWGDGKVFLISAIWGLAGAVFTIIWLPDTTGLELEEYDRLQVCVHVHCCCNARPVAGPGPALPVPAALPPPATLHPAPCPALLQRYILEGRFKDYHGEAVNRKHLSFWEVYIQKWHLQYDPELDRKVCGGCTAWHG
jgi:hypothetical protein